MERVWLAIGSNLHDPLKQVRVALESLSKLPKTYLSLCSSYYRSRPLGPQNQEDFLNAVVALDTELVPETLLHYTQSIELNQGRCRKKECRFGPRTIDLDILLFGNRTIMNTNLEIPHYDMHNRAFMLYPLLELEPDLCFPNGEKISERLSQIPCNGLAYWDKKHRGPIKVNTSTF